MTDSSSSFSKMCAGLLLVLIGLTSSILADTKLPPSPNLPHRVSQLEGMVNPLTGEVLSTLNPLQAETAKEQRKKQALARYMSGRIAVERRRVPAALDAFEKAIELDPEAIESYKAIIPLLLMQRKTDEAQEYAIQSARKTDEGYQLILVMATLFARQTQIDRGIELMQQSLGTRSIKAGSKEELLIHRDLGLFNRLNKNFPDASEEYQLVFERVTSGEFDASTLKEILKDPGKNFDEFGDTFLKAGHPELALKAYEEASKHREAKPGLHSFNLATVFKQTGKPKQALESLQEYFDAKLQSRGRAPYLLLEALLTELKKEGELLSQLESLLQTDESNEVLRYFLADRILQQKEIEKAKELFLHGKETVTDPRALVGMLSIYRQEDDVEKLLGVLTKAFQVVPRGNEKETLDRLEPDLRFLSETFEAELDTLKEDDKTIIGVFDHARTLKEGDDPKLDFIQAYLLGKLATEGDYTDAALDFYKHAISMRNDPPSQLYLEIGGHLIDSKRYKDAIAILKEAVNHPSNSLRRDRWRFLFFLSYGHEFLGETEEALQVIQDAIKTAPNAGQGRLEYQEAWIYQHSGNLEKALEKYAGVIAKHSTNTELKQDSQFRVSAIYVEQGDMAKGEQVLENVLKDDPENIQANNDLGYLWADQGKNLDKALTMIEKALAESPENPAYLDSMGWVLFKQGEYTQAVEYLTTATEQKNGDDSTIFDHLGDALNKLGKTKEAQTNYQRALEIEQDKEHPGEKLLKSIQEKLKPTS